MDIQKIIASLNQKGLSGLGEKLAKLSAEETSALLKELKPLAKEKSAEQLAAEKNLAAFETLNAPIIDEYVRLKEAVKAFNAHVMKFKYNYKWASASGQYPQKPGSDYVTVINGPGKGKLFNVAKDDTWINQIKHDCEITQGQVQAILKARRPKAVLIKK